MEKVFAIHSGGDWSDASVEYLVKVSDINVEDLHKKYLSDGGYQTTGLHFPDWLVKSGHFRPASESDVEIFWEH